MSTFTKNAVTVKGSVAIAALIAGGTLEFTRIAVGDGEMKAGQTPMQMEDLVHRLFDVKINEIDYNSEAHATIKGVFSNEDNAGGFYYRELGLFAKDPVTGDEILYCYGNAEGDAEWINPVGEGSLIEKEVHIVTLVGNATTVTASIASGVYATQEMMYRELSKKADLDARYDQGGRVVPEQMRFDASQTLYVDSLADASFSDGSTGRPYKTIQAAVDAAYMGADLIKIEIKPGTYAENVRTPVGTSSSWVFEKWGTGTVSSKSFTIDIAPYIRIEGMTLTPDAGGRAIRMVNVASAAIESNIIYGNTTGFGVSVFRGSVRLNANTINNCGTAIYAAEGAVVTSITTAGSGNVVALHAEGAIILQHPDSTIVGTTTYKQSNGGAVNMEGGASSFPSSFGQRSSLGEFSSAVTLRARLLLELQKLNEGEFKSFTFRQSISGGFGALAANQTSHVLIQKTANTGGGYGILIFYSHASAPVSTMKINAGAFVETGPVLLIDETRIATPESYGIMKAATPDVCLDDDADDAAITPAVYHDVSDFRHKSTAYQLGDRVRCMFNMELNLECTQAGTTSANPLDTRNATHGQVITDGTVQWTVRTFHRSTNGVYPDAEGDVKIDVGVKTINGEKPDASGDYKIPEPEIASQAEAEEGANNEKHMTPLRVKQAIDELAPQADWDAAEGKSQILNKPDLAEVATSGSYNDLKDKPATPKAYITSTYKSGSNWYRKWSDGWIQQGGKCGKNSGTVSFVTRFTDYENCTLVGTPISGGHPDDCYCVLNATSNTTFSVNAWRFGDVKWYACGY